ncbi:MAG: glycosyltransferase family 39 protein [Nitrospirae bacterium]|nr:glycosyltransferase family 39 protein [Nitrospirota bacterium]
MKKTYSEWISNFLRYVLLAGALLYVVIYFFLVFSRIQYPFELMWQEGASVDHVKRIVDGYKYYVSPSLEFVPSIYTPLYFYISAFVSKLTGIGFMPLRLVSFLSSIGSFVIIYLIVKSETGRTFPALLALCLFAASYKLSGAWLDIGRPDSLFLFFCLSSLYILKFGKSASAYILSGVLMALSFYTKQTALAISLPVTLCVLLTNRRCAVYFITTLAVFIGLGSIFLNYKYDGWFNFYVFELPRTTPIFTRYLASFWTKDIISPFFAALAVASVYLLTESRKTDRKTFIFYCLVATGMLLASWYSRLRGGGYFNVMFPAYATVSVLFGLGVNQLFETSKALSSVKLNIAHSVIYLICIFQFGSLIYNPFSQIPTEMDLEAGKLFIEKMAQIDGEVYSPFHGYLPILAGKKSYANQMGMRDVLTTWSKKHSQIKARLIDEIKEAVREKKFSAIIIDSFEPWYPYDMDKYYVKRERIFDDEKVFIPVTGTETRPEYIYVPLDNASIN